MTGTVFIIDDDAGMRRSLRRLLRAEGIPAEDFNSARAYLEREPFDGVGCILLDINMPGISGIELQAQLADTGYDIPIIFLTGYGNIPMSVEAMKRGALDFLTKPVDEAGIDSALNKIEAVLAETVKQVLVVEEEYLPELLD